MGIGQVKRTKHSKQWNWIVRLGVWFFITILLTVILGIWIFNPWDKIKISSGLDEGRWNYIPAAPSDSLKDSISEIIGTKFNLDWYDLCIKTGGLEGETYLVKFSDESIISLKNNEINCNKRLRVSERFEYSVDVNFPSTQESIQQPNIVYSEDGKTAYVPGSITVESGEIYARPNGAFIIAKFVSIWVIINILLLLAIDVRGRILNGWD